MLLRPRYGECAGEIGLRGISRCGAEVDGHDATGANPALDVTAFSPVSHRQMLIRRPDVTPAAIQSGQPARVAGRSWAWLQNGFTRSAEGPSAERQRVADKRAQCETRIGEYMVRHERRNSGPRRPLAAVLRSSHPPPCRRPLAVHNSPESLPTAGQSGHHSADRDP